MSYILHSTPLLTIYSFDIGAAYIRKRIYTYDAHLNNRVGYALYFLRWQFLWNQDPGNVYTENPNESNMVHKYHFLFSPAAVKGYWAISIVKLRADEVSFKLIGLQSYF